ncbi:hypothetical protein FM076_15585 [Streptomyces albus subsp. chlorinus]|uniref:hypothetical protein n=1 Tax=Streptomyces albus TaxID=1888 RepID=UPI00156DAD12|nr:hypothetical protein [Streptomyces albus subsp. chlorinus]
MRERAPEHQPDPLPAADGIPHETSLSERGSFCSASCACGWRGPARRARERARADALDHQQSHPGEYRSGRPDHAARPDTAAPPPDTPTGAL